MNEPYVSIIIPLYNAEKFLKSLIESIIIQTYKSWELIFVDDYSSDSSTKIVEEYTNKFSQIRLYKKSDEHKGANVSRNIGIKLSKGEYICFFDADDIISKKCLESRVRFMEENRNLDIGVFRAITFNTRPYDNILTFGFRTYSDPIALIASGHLPFAVWTNIYRRSSLMFNNIKWDENLKSLQDSDFNIETLQAGLKIGYSESAPDYFWRVSCNDGSISKKIYSKEHLTSRIYFINKLYKKIGDQYKTQVLLRVLDFMYSLLDSPEDDFNEFLNSDLFSKNMLLRVRCHLCYEIYNKFNYKSSYFKSVIKLFCFPIPTIISIVCRRKWNKVVLTQYNSAKIYYNEVIDNYNWN